MARHPLFAFVCAAAAAGLACSASDDDIRCATGTHLEDGRCVAGAPSFSCGAGTHLENGACVSDAAAVTCGAGTWPDGLVCRPMASGETEKTCGPGTRLEGTACVPDSTTRVACGSGTHAEGTVCMPDPSMTCRSGTHLDGARCAPDALVVCGPGTHADAGRCVQDAATMFEVRIGARTIPADGYSKIPVLALGRNADGTASSAEVVLWVSRPGSGSFSPTYLRLGELGATSYFVPCSHASTGCTGPVEIRMSLASDSATPVATTGPVELVAPEGVYSPAPCLVGGNVVFFDGDAGDWVHHGTATIRDAAFSAPYPDPSDVRIHVVPSDRSQGLWWDLELSSRMLGSPLVAQAYHAAERAAFASPGHPGLDVGGDGRGCNTITGAFEIHEIAWVGEVLDRVTATFEQHCEGGTAALRGCVHYER